MDLPEGIQDFGALEDQANLTKREEEILGYVAKGFVNKEIADTLAVSVETIRTHLKSIYEKLHLRPARKPRLNMSTNSHALLQFYFLEILAKQTDQSGSGLEEISAPAHGT
jgi:DNA-binding NarL/FixJ family response regulator